jgi:hypothetical protein
MGVSLSGLTIRRPTVTDLRFRGDAWVEDACDGTLSLYLGNYPLAALRGLAFDLPHLNQVVDRLRQEPRARVCYTASRLAGGGIG